MATLEEAIANLRAALARVHQLSSQRDAVARRRTVAVGEIAALNEQIAAARVTLAEARAETAEILNAPAPEPAPGG